MTVIYLLQAKCENQWLTCYKFKYYQDALDHKHLMDKQYDRLHRIYEKSIGQSDNEIEQLNLQHELEHNQ